MILRINSNVKSFKKRLNRVQKKQIPFATANAINMTLFQLRKEMGKQTEKHLDRPTNATKNGFLVNKASKKTLRGSLYIKWFVAKYLKYQIDGGIRTSDSGKKIAVPTRNVRLNKFGNVPGRKSGLIKRDNQKILTIKDMSGIWQTHKDRTLKLLHIFKDSVSYSPKFPYWRIAFGFTKSQFNKNMTKSLKRALRTAK